MTHKPFVPVAAKLQVRHHAQVPCNPFSYEVANEREAFLISDALAKQHLFLYEQKIIADYANVIEVVMWDEPTNDWIDYFNVEEFMDFDELVEKFLSSPQTQTP